jgi:hypothetical protein
MLPLKELYETGGEEFKHIIIIFMKVVEESQ